MVMNAILLDPTDNVATCVKEIKAGEEVRYRFGDRVYSLLTEETIPYCHKIALKSFDKGEEIIKYGELIGKTTEKIEKGCWVSHQNVYSVPRDYESEYVDVNEQKSEIEVQTSPSGLKQFWGYKRAEGRAGIRNHVLILPACACGSETSRIVASQVRGAVNIVFNTGCSDVAANTAMSQKVLTGFACNPNVYGVVIVGLGCETVPHKELKEKIETLTSKPIVSFGIQELPVYFKE